MDIKYTIIIPHYNIPDLLSRCLKSIPERDDFQIIVVDDNSPNQENYKKIVPELSRNNVEYYVTLDGKGAGNARNHGLNHAKGEWILFADADDFFVDGMESILDQYANCLEDIIYFDYKRCQCDKPTEILEETNKPLYEYCKAKNDFRYFRFSYGTPWAKMYRRNLIERNNIKFQEVKANNDTIFVVTAGLCATRIKVTTECLYWYTYRAGSIANAQTNEPLSKILDRVYVHESLQNLLDKYNIKTCYNLTASYPYPVLGSDPKRFFKILSVLPNRNISIAKFIWGTLCILYYRKIKGIPVTCFNNDIYDLSQCTIKK